jgi:hemerythrin superfamily protein
LTSGRATDRSLPLRSWRIAKAPLNTQLHVDFPSDPQEAAPVNAIDLLEQQHRDVKTLFKKYEKATAAAEKRKLFEQIADDLAVHAAIEEKHFYPATKSARTQDLLQEAVEEHLQAKRIIADLLEMDADDAQFDAKMTVLREEIDHHVEEEEGELFPKVEKLLADDELEDLGMVMEDLAEELKEEGSPRAQVPAETGEAAPL